MENERPRSISQGSSSASPARLLPDPQIYWNDEFVRDFLRCCNLLRAAEPSRGVSFAEKGLELAARCRESSEMEAYASAVLAGALRGVGQIAEADRLLSGVLAEVWTLEPGARAEVLTQQALLRRDQGCFSEALDLIDRVAYQHRAIGREPDLHAFGLTTMIRFSINRGSGAFGEALDDIGIALKYIDVEGAPESFSAAIHNLAFLVQETSRSSDVQTAARHVKEAFRRGGFGRRSALRGKLYWVLGLVDLRLGSLRHAERTFRLAHEIFVEQGLPYDVALVSLDLGTILLEDERWAELEEIASETVPVFRSQIAETEAIAALVLWREAIRHRCISAEIHQRLRAAVWAGTRSDSSDTGIRQPRKRHIHEPFV